MKRHIGRIKTCVLVAVGLLLVGVAGACTDSAPSNPGDAGVDGGADSSRTKLIPDELPADSICLGNGWCWLEPSPSPHSIDDLKAGEDGVRGVGELDDLRGEVPFRWGETFEIPQVPIPDDEELLRLTPSSTGWLAVTDAGVVYEFDGRGHVETRDLPWQPDGVGELVGRSIDWFIVDSTDHTPVVVRDGELSQVSTLDSGDTTMWQNGDVWEIGPEDPDAARFDDETWRAFPTPPAEFNHYLEALGPPPDSPCSDVGIWVNAKEGLHRWDAESGTWSPTDYDSPEVNAIGCDGRGNLLVVDKEAGFSRLTDDGWKRTQLEGLDLVTIANAEGRAHLAGRVGTLLELKGSEVTRRSKGLSMPAGERPFPDPVNEIWVSPDGSDGFVTHSSGLYRWSNAGWKMAGIPEDIELTAYGNFDTFWGTDEPEYVIFQRQLLESGPDGWGYTSIGRLENPIADGAVDLAGPTDDNLWLARSKALHESGGFGWINKTPNGSAANQTIREDLLSFSTVWTTPDGEARFLADGDIYRLEEDGLGEDLKMIDEPPCGGGDVHLTDDGTLYLATNRGCVARRDAEGWTEFNSDFDAFDPDEIRSVSLIEQPDSNRPLVIAGFGLLQLMDGGSLQMKMLGQFTDGVYLPDRNITVLLHRYGILVKYH